MYATISSKLCVEQHLFIFFVLNTYVIVYTLAKYIDTCWKMKKSYFLDKNVKKISIKSFQIVFLIASLNRVDNM